MATFFSSFHVDATTFDLDEALTMPQLYIVQQNGEATKRSSAISHVVIIDNLETVVNASEVNDDVCSICVEGFDSSSCCKRATCGHVYHASCIATWLSISSSCPLCRCNIMNSCDQSTKTM